MLFEAPLPATGADLRNLAASFFPAAAGAAFHLRHKASGRHVPDCPRHFAVQCQGILIIEPLRPYSLCSGPVLQGV